MTTQFNPTIPKTIFSTVGDNSKLSTIEPIEYKGLQVEGFLFTGFTVSHKLENFHPVYCFLTYEQMKGTGKELKTHLENAVWNITEPPQSRNKELFLEGLDSLNDRLKKEVSFERLDKDRREWHISNVQIGRAIVSSGAIHDVTLLAQSKTSEQSHTIIFKSQLTVNDEQLEMGADWMIGYIQNVSLDWTPIIHSHTSVYQYFHDELWNLPFVDEQPVYYYRGQAIVSVDSDDTDNDDMVIVHENQDVTILTSDSLLFTDQNESITHYHLSAEYKQVSASALKMVQEQEESVREIQDSIDLEVAEFRAKKEEKFETKFLLLKTMKSFWLECVENLKSAHLAQWEKSGKPDKGKTSRDKVLGIAVTDKIGISSVSVFQDYVFTELPQYVIKKVNMPKLTKDWKTGHVDIPMGAEPTQSIALKLTESKLLDQYLPLKSDAAGQTDGTFEID